MPVLGCQGLNFIPYLKINIMKRIILLSICTIALLTLSCKEKKESILALTENKENINASKILFILSNASFYGNSEIEASNHFAEIVLAYDEFKKAGWVVDFVSPKGGEIPVGYLDTTSTTQKKYLNNSEFMNLLKTTKSPKEINTSDYIAVYYGGGGAAMFGVPENIGIQNISMAVYEENKGIISAVCHGSAGLAYLKTKDGEFLVANKKVNGYPDQFESMDDDYYATFPFSIEQKLKENGGDFRYSEEGWDDFSIEDGRLITGQDPTAARSVAKIVITKLQQL